MGTNARVESHFCLWESDKNLKKFPGVGAQVSHLQNCDRICPTSIRRRAAGVFFDPFWSPWAHQCDPTSIRRPHSRHFGPHQEISSHHIRCIWFTKAVLEFRLFGYEVGRTLIQLFYSERGRPTLVTREMFVDWWADTTIMDKKTTIEHHRCGP